MSISHRTNRLKLVGTPAVEQLQNGRYQLTVSCTTINRREDWYSANKSRIFPDFGSLQSAEMSIDGLAPRTGEAYSDMRLVSVQSSTQGELYIVTLVYQTLGDSFVQVKDDTVNYIENGLRRVTRKSIAKAGTDFQKTVGTTSITSQIDNETAVTCVLANYEVDDTDSYREVTEVYIEAGTLSETEDKVGSQLSIVKETFSSTPSTPSGYSIANEQESNVDGIPTRRFTFLKNNVQLSRSVDNQSSLLTETREYFKPDSSKETLANYSLVNKSESNVDGIPTERYTFAKDNQQISKSVDNESPLKTETREYFKPDSSKETLAGYSLVNKQESNVDGIPTERYTFAKNNVTLSETEDKVGGQLAIVKEVFNGTPSTPSGYSVASEQESNVDGIPTKRFTFLKPNILSVEQTFNDGEKRVSVQAFDKTSSEVTSALTEVTSDHKLISQRESNFAGIKTSTFEYQLDESFIQDRELNGLNRIRLIELSASDFTAQTIGAVSSTAPTSGLFLGSQVIDNGGTIKTRQSVWLEAGTLSVSESNESEGVIKVTTTFLVTEGTTVGPVIARTTGEFSGLKTISVTTLQDSSGQSIVHGNSNTVHQYNRMVDFTYPGVVSIVGDKIEDGSVVTNLYNFNLKPPVQAKIESRVSVIFQTSADIVPDDFTFNDGDGGGSGVAATGLWNPTEWASTYMSGIAWNYSPFSETKGLRGYRINTATSGVVANDGPDGTIIFSHLGVVVIQSKAPEHLAIVTTTTPLSASINAVSDSQGLRTIVNGNRIFASTPYRMEVFGGPTDPVGFKFTLDVDLRPAFTDVDGNTYYKKTIITSTIPAQ